MAGSRHGRSVPHHCLAVGTAERWPDATGPARWRPACRARWPARSVRRRVSFFCLKTAGTTSAVQGARPVSCPRTRGPRPGPRRPNIFCTKTILMIWPIAGFCPDWRPRSWRGLRHRVRCGGFLAIMTCFQTDDDRFAGWHYRKDPTHIVFYREATFRYLSGVWGWTCEVPVKDVVLMQRPKA